MKRATWADVRRKRALLAIDGLYLSILRKSEETPVSTNGAPIYRIIPFRRFEIRVSLAVSAEDPYDVTFQLKGGSNLGVLGRAGHSIQIHNGPFTHRWAYFNAESAGQAAVDTFLDAQHEA